MSDVNYDMIAACPDGSVFFDIGANHGKYTVVMAAKPGSKVYAFEPAPQNLKELRDAVRDKPNVEVHGLALSDHNGIEKLMLVGNPGGHSIEKKLDGGRWRHNSANSVNVAVITLDEWAQYNDIDRVDGVKIDVEAHEESVLKGAKETLTKYHPIIALETHQTVDTGNIRKMLLEYGYEVKEELKMDNGYLFRSDGK